MAKPQHGRNGGQNGNGGGGRAAAPPPPEEQKIPEEAGGTSTGTELTTTGNHPLPAATSVTTADDLMDMADASEGRGVSRSAEDVLIPLIYVLQSNSPQVDPGDAAHIQGAVQGHLWLRNFSTPIVPGNEGILFQPCYFYKDWNRWTPRDSGGGFQGSYASVTDVKEGGKVVAMRVPNGELVRERPDPRDPQRRKTIWAFDNGDELKETRHHIGFVILRNGLAVPFAINLTGTGHTVSRNWMFAIGNKVTRDGRLIDSWKMVWHIPTKQRQNKLGKWYEMDPRDAAIDPATRLVISHHVVPGTLAVGPDGSVVYPTGEVAERRLPLPQGLYADKVGVARGEALFKALASGARKIETDEPDAGGDVVVQANGNGDPGYQGGGEDPGAGMNDEVPF